MELVARTETMASLIRCREMNLNNFSSEVSLPKPTKHIGKGQSMPKTGKLRNRKTKITRDKWIVNT